MDKKIMQKKAFNFFLHLIYYLTELFILDDIFSCASGKILL